MDTLTPGGINTVVRELAVHLARNGHQVIVFNPSWTRKKLQHNRYGNLIIVKGYGYNRFLYGLSARNIILKLKLVRSIKPDVIHFHGFHNLFIPTGIFLTKLFFPSIPIVFSPHYAPGGHSSFFSRKSFRLYTINIGKLLYKLVDAVVCSSLFELKSFINFTNINETRKINLIPHGVSYERTLCNEYTKPMPKTSKASEVFEKPLKLLYVGYLLEYKGVQDAIRALSILNKEHRINAILTIIGEGPYKQELVNLAKQLGIEHSIIWKSFVKREELIKEYCQTDVFVFPSRGEMFGLVAYEALALGKPTLVAKRTALRECCYNYSSCICIKNSEELADKILELLNSDLNMTSLKLPLSWNEVASLYLNLYKKLHEEIKKTVSDVGITANLDHFSNSKIELNFREIG
jgi:glycosyltransferase involved in cell wall biosynthesis